MIFDFKENYILENEFVRLEPLKHSDFEVLLNYSENEQDIWEFNSGGANGKENLEKYISNAIIQRQNEKEYAFVIFDKELGNMLVVHAFMLFFWKIKLLKLDTLGMEKNTKELG